MHRDSRTIFNNLKLKIACFHLKFLILQDNCIKLMKVTLEVVIFLSFISYISTNFQLIVLLFLGQQSNI